MSKLIIFLLSMNLSLLYSNNIHHLLTEDPTAKIHNLQDEIIRPSQYIIWNKEGFHRSASLKTLSSSLEEGGKALIIATPIDSPEVYFAEDFTENFALFSVGEWKEKALEEGLTTTYSNVEHSLLKFENEADLVEWLQTTFPSKYVGLYLERLWESYPNYDPNKPISIPSKRLHLVVEKPL